MIRKDPRAETKRFVSETKNLYSTNMTMEDIYTVIVERCPKAYACIYFDDSGKPQHDTFDEFRNQVFRTASQLSRLFSSIAPRTIVGLKIKNSPRWPVFFWAILMSGHIPLLIDARLATDNANNLLRQADAKALICNDEGDFIVPTYRVNDVMNLDVNYGFNPDFADNVIFCSSGTTGDAKMMIYSGRNMCHQILASLPMPDKNADIMFPGDLRLLAMLPFHHIFGFAATYLWFTFYGKTMVYPSSLATNDLLYACRVGKCSHIFSVPLFWDGIAQTVSRTIVSLKPSKSDLVSKMIAYNTHKISRREAGFAATKLARKAFQKKVLGTHVRFCISGGGFLSPKTQALINGLGYNLYNGFGMTEVGIVAVDFSERVEQRMKGSIGAPFYGVEFKLDCKPGETQGELMIKSEQIHEEEIIGGKRRKTVLEDGYFRTGDIATADNHGLYYIKGRIKDTIILANGENVFPDEIEYYFKDVALLNNVVCLGAKRPGQDEEKITLVCEVDNSATEEQIKKVFEDIKAINDTLPSEKKVQDILIDKRPLPMSSSMKVKRFVLKEAIEKGSSDFVGLGVEQQRQTVSFKGYDPKEVEDTVSRVTKVFSKILMLPEFKIDPEAIWNTDLGGDSMSYIDMCQTLNKEFKVEIPEEQYGILGCVNDFAKEILDLKASSSKK